MLQTAKTSELNYFFPLVITLANSRTLLDEKDIGVITPYNAQSHRLRQSLGEGIKVGSVEEFQGQVSYLDLTQCCLTSVLLRNAL